MVRWFKSGHPPGFGWRGRCAVDTCNITHYVWYKEWPNLGGGKKDTFQRTLQHNIDSGRWIEDESLALDKDLLVDEGL